MNLPLTAGKPTPCLIARVDSSPMAHRLLKDPVCGMSVTDKSFHHVAHQGQTHYFCSARCKLRFATAGPRPTHAESAKTALPADATVQHRLKWRTAWLLSLALLAALWLAGRWLLSR